MIQIAGLSFKTWFLIMYTITLKLNLLFIEIGLYNKYEITLFSSMLHYLYYVLQYIPVPRLQPPWLQGQNPPSISPVCPELHSQLWPGPAEGNVYQLLSGQRQLLSCRNAIREKKRKDQKQIKITLRNAHLMWNTKEKIKTEKSLWFFEILPLFLFIKLN